MRRWLVLAVLAGCGDNAPPAVDAATGVEMVALPAETTSKLDLLFVLDNENTTVEHRLALRDAFRSLLVQISIDGRPDLHIGAITPDLGVTTASGKQGVPTACSQAGDAGRLQMSNTSIPDPYLIDSAEASNHPLALETDIFWILEMSDTGCAFQQHLSAARAAFLNPYNAGFRRSDAALGIVVLADQDDCSVLDPSIFGPASPELGAQTHFRCAQFGVVCDEPDMTAVGPRTNCRPNTSSTEIEDPAAFVDVFRVQASDPRRVAFGAIVATDSVAIEQINGGSGLSPIPWLAPACEWQAYDGVTVAEPAVRLGALAKQFGDRGSLGSICSADLSAAEKTVGIGLRRAMGDPCVEGDFVLNQCTAVDELAGKATPIPPCGASSESCWELVTDPTTCPNAAHQKLVVHRSAKPPAGTYALLRC